MNTRLELTLVFVLSMVCMPVHAGDNKNCGLKQLASLDLQKLPGRVLVPVSVQGAPVWMVLQTGSAFSLMYDENVRALQLHRMKLPLAPGVSVGQKGEVSQVAIPDDLQIGGMHYPKVSFAIVSRQGYYSPPSFDQRPIIGALGMDVLSTADFELDIAHGKLNLFSHDHCSGRVVYWSGIATSLPLKRGDYGEFYFPIKLDGKALEAELSSASENSALRADVAHRFYGFDEHSADNRTLTSATGGSHAYRFMNVATPAFEVRNAVITLDPQINPHCVIAHHGSDGVGYDGCSGPHPLTLGISVLSKLRIYVATKERVLYLSPADAAVPDAQQGADKQ
jgi:hypothetical protein